MQVNLGGHVEPVKSMYHFCLHHRPKYDCNLLPSASVFVVIFILSTCHARWAAVSLYCDSLVFRPSGGAPFVLLVHTRHVLSG